MFAHPSGPLTDIEARAITMTSFVAAMDVRTTIRSNRPSPFVSRPWSVIGSAKTAHGGSNDVPLWAQGANELPEPPHGGFPPQLVARRSSPHGPLLPAAHHKRR